MMRRLSTIGVTLLLTLAAALPALAQEENPLAHARLFTGGTAWGMIGVTVLLMILFMVWARRGPN
jgi:hypothetical protein